MIYGIVVQTQRTANMPALIMSNSNDGLSILIQMHLVLMPERSIFMTEEAQKLNPTQN